jgi:hypothetical protein
MTKAFITVVTLTNTKLVICTHLEIFDVEFGIENTAKVA